MPERLGKLAKKVRPYGVLLEKPKSGSHYKFVRDGVRYPISAHNGLKTEIPDLYIRGLCRTFDIDPADL